MAGYRRKKRRHPVLKVLLTVLFIVLIAAGFVGFQLYQKYSLGNDKADMNSYFNMSDGDTAIILNDQIVEELGFADGDEVYVPISFAQRYLSPRFYYDDSSKRLMYVLPTDILYSDLDEESYYIGSDKTSLDYAPIKEKGDTIYLNLNFAQEYSKMNYVYNDDPSRVQINTRTDEIKLAKIEGDTQIRVLGGVKSPVLRDIKDGEQVEFMEKGSPWSKIHTSDGFIGYVQNKHLKKLDKTLTYEYDAKLPEYPNVSREHAISLAWHQITGEAGNATLEDYTKDMSGVNVIAPTWFFINDTSGAITSLADEEYVQKAHEMGLEVWGVINDFDGATINGGINSSDETYDVLSNTPSRQHLIEMVVGEAVRVGMDGINVDIEKVNKECGVHFSEFAREMSLECRRHNIVFSIDNYPPVFTPQYDRQEQGEVADYLIIMAYDEHGTWSDEYGSVASIDYVKTAIEDTIKENVPSEKILLGIPFYTRIWTEDANGSFTSESVGMDEVSKAISDASADVKWEDKYGQNFASWTLDDGSAKMIWIEDGKSIALKMKQYKDYGLGGVAFWKLGKENSNIWSVVKDNL